MKRVIITGSTGMVGKGVLLECLDSDQIAKVLVVNRRSLEMDHPKLKELLLPDFTSISQHREKLAGYDACFFCMGVSAIGMSEENYSKITLNITKAFADVLYELNPNLVFNYVSGTGTDSTEKGRIMWARVKGKTENYVLNKGFAAANAFRPGFIIPKRGIKSATGWYNTAYVVLRPLFPFLKKSKSITTTTKIGNAMINSLSQKLKKKHLNNQAINKLAQVN